MATSLQRVPVLHPAEGDLVTWRDQRYGTSGHTGRVLARRGSLLRVKATAGRVHVLNLDEIEGYWPKGARDRSFSALRRLKP